MKKNQKGITLVSMVITIIVMLILAGVSISAALGDDGVATRGSQAAVKNKLAKVAEDFDLALTDVGMEYDDLWTKTSSISAYKSVFVTKERLNASLNESKVLNNDAIIKSRFDYSQKQVVGATQAPMIPEISDVCYTDLGHPICSIAFSDTISSSTGKLSSLKGTKSSNTYFALYLSNGTDEVSYGKDVFVAVCKLEDGYPLLIDLGVVESDLDPDALVNGRLEFTSGKITQPEGETPTAAIENGGILPISVTWLNNAVGLENRENGVAK